MIVGLDEGSIVKIRKRMEGGRLGGGRIIAKDNNTSL